MICAHGTGVGCLACAGDLVTLRAELATLRAELELAERDRRAAEYVRDGLSAYVSSISGALMDSDVTVYEGDYARSIRELAADRDRMRPVVEAAVEWFEEGDLPALAQSLSNYLASEPTKETK